jgi:D-glycero-D-manno-heptose 1,7-bisphosphate phosphatase
LVRTQGYRLVGPAHLDEFYLRSEAELPLWRLKQAGFVLVATTNQPGLSTGSLTRHELDRMHARLRERFPLDDILVCPHDESDHCLCRKPRPGLFQEAAFKWKLDLERSYVVSDKWQDAQAADNAGCTSVMVRSPWIGSHHHDFVFPTLEAVVVKILALKVARHSWFNTDLAVSDPAPLPLAGLGA